LTERLARSWFPALAVDTPELVSKSATSMKENNLNERAKLWRTPTALQLPSDHPQARAWLEPWIELEEDIETVGPDRKLVVYTAPSELRPLEVRPVVRWMSWPQARRSDLEHGPSPQIRLYALDVPLAPIESAAHELNEALRQFPYTVDGLDSTVAIELPPTAYTWRSIRSGTRRTHVELGWTTGRSTQLDAAWDVLWDRIASKVEGHEALVGWHEIIA
jgi:hypothetical protein